MESLIMASRVVIPMAIMVGIGMILRIVKLTDEPTMKKVDKLIFNVFMPMLSFYNIYKTDFSICASFSIFRNTLPKASTAVSSSPEVAAKP